MRRQNRTLLEPLESRMLMSASAVVASAVSFGGLSDDRIMSVAADSAGNIYATGFFQSTITIGGTQLTSSDNNNDIFVCKMSKTGAFQWAFKIGSATGDEPTHMLVDSAGNIYISGYYTNNIDVDPGAGTHTLNVSAPFDADAFFAKYDTDGNFLWATNVSGSSYDAAGKILRDPSSGDIYWNGTFTGAVTFAGGLNSEQLTANSNFGDPFLARFSPDGTLVGVSQNMSAGALDGDGNIYTAWNLNAPTDIDPGASTVTVTPFGTYAVSIAKYDSDLNLLWHKDLNGVYAAVNDLAVDSHGNIVAVGNFAQSFRFDPAGKFGLLKEPASPDAMSGFIFKLDANGKFAWATALKGAGKAGNYSGWSNAWAVKVDSLDNIYVGGDCNGKVNFGRPLRPRFLTSAGDDDGFLAGYSAAGNLKWIKTIGGTTYDRISAFDLSPTGKIIAAGYVSGEVATAAGTMSTDGSNDAFIAQIAPPFVHKLPIGRFDVVSANLITGYALDPNDGTAGLTVRIFIDGVLVNAQTADIDRPDLVAPQNFPPITTEHGFSYAPIAPLAGWHTIKVFALDSTTSAPRLIALKRMHF